MASYLHAESAPVRASAAQSLGLLGDESKRELLVELLPKEARGAVRAAMASALRELPAQESSLRAVLDIVQNERNHEARTMMVRYLVVRPAGELRPGSARPWPEPDLSGPGLDSPEARRGPAGE